MSLIPFPIFAPKSGLVTNKKPVFLPNDAWQVLENAYTYRERIKKREGLQFLSRLRRVFSTPVTLGTQASGATYTNNDILNDPSIHVRSTQPNAELDVGSVIVTVGPLTFTDQGNGLLTCNTTNFGSINYSTGKLVLHFSPGIAATNVDVVFNYFPSLPVMGIATQEQAAQNDEATIWFDTTYAYVWAGGSSQTNNIVEFIAATTWTGGNSDFFWWYNYRGASVATKLLFVSNFLNDVPNSNFNPMYYTNGASWTAFHPLATAAITIFTAKIIIAYYGRLLLLNTWEGATGGGGATASNFFNRCRFSQLGDPTSVDAFRADIFGLGGVLDAPVNESITGATFVKNTLIVDFERSTWELRYVGEYGLPFIWERISADFGSESTFSGVLFDNHRLAVGDKGITAGNAISVNRIDDSIPDQIFQFQNINDGNERVFGIRDYQRELVFWNFPDAQTQASAAVPLIFPNKVLVYNYKNQSWAIFRDSVTAFGQFQLTTNVNWGSFNTFWGDMDTTWNDFDSNVEFPYICCGNQQGYIHLYGYTTPDQQSLTIHSIDLTTSPVQITSANHNLQPEEIVYITDLNFLDPTGTSVAATTLNDQFFQVAIIDQNILSILKWNVSSQEYDSNFSFTPASDSLYAGGGQMALMPKLNATTKDINIFQTKGLNTKLSYIDFLMAATPSSAVTVQLLLNASKVFEEGLQVGQTNVPTNLTPPFYQAGSDYSWFRFYATLSAQYFAVSLTYDDNLMNTYSTHQQTFELLGMNAWCRPGARNPF